MTHWFMSNSTRQQRGSVVVPTTARAFAPLYLLFSFGVYDSRLVALTHSKAKILYSSYLLCGVQRQVPDASLAAFSERYAVAAASVTKSGVGLDLERIEATAAASARGKEYGNFQDDESCEESSEESSSLDDSSSSDEESTSADEESTSTEEQSSSEEGEEEEEASITTAGAAVANGAVAADADADANAGSVGAESELLLVGGTQGTRKGVQAAAAAAVDTTSCSSSATSKIETSAELLQLESRIMDGAGIDASIVAGRLSLLSLEKSRLCSGGVSVEGAPGAEKSTNGAGDGCRDADGTDAGAGEGRRIGIVEEM